MDSDELARELGHPTAQELLQRAPLARLAYNGHDGFPRVIPCGFLWNGADIVVCTAPTAPKAGALAARPAVALTIDDADTPAGARALFVRGTARLDVIDGVAEEYLEAATKTMEGTDLVAFERAVRATYEKMVRISITPQWARCFDFGTGRLPRYLEDLVAGT